jgi:hypothetical protein
MPPYDIYGLPPPYLSPPLADVVFAEFAMPLAAASRLLLLKVFISMRASPP